MKRIGLTYNELIDILQKNGWGFFPADSSWRADKNDPLSEPAVTREALRDMCEIYPVLTRQMLDLLLAGHEFDVSLTQIGFVTTITLQPRPVLISDNPPTFARPVKL